MGGRAAREVTAARGWAAEAEEKAEADWAAPGAAGRAAAATEAAVTAAAEVEVAG